MRQPGHTGERGTCPGCEATVISKVGPIVRPHWAHKEEGDCDPWAGGETDWHLNWKLLALKAGWSVETPLREDDPPVLHRADATGPRKNIVEFQHSSLTTDEMKERTEFYGRHGTLCWVFNGSIPRWRRLWWKWKSHNLDLPGPSITHMAIDETDREDQPGSIWLWDVDGDSTSRFVDRESLFRHLSRPPDQCLICGTPLVRGRISLEPLPAKCSICPPGETCLHVAQAWWCPRGSEHPAPQRGSGGVVVVVSY